MDLSGVQTNNILIKVLIIIIIITTTIIIFIILIIYNIGNINLIQNDNLIDNLINNFNWQFKYILIIQINNIDNNHRYY